MLDIKLIRENPELVKKNLKKRGKTYLEILDKVIEFDNLWRTNKSDLDKLKAEKNIESKNISKIKKEGGDIKLQITKVKKVSDKIDEKEKKLNELDEKRLSFLIRIPNLLDAEVPIGDDENENEVIKTIGKKPKFDFKIKNHQELCELNDWYDLQTSAKHSGARFYYLKNELFMLELALYNFVFEKLIKKGFTPIEVPPILRKESIGKSVSLTDFDDVIYKIESDEGDHCLIATAEPALAILHNNQILPIKDLPKKYAGLSPCFRKEAGVTKDEKGIFRVHNFNKIEQFVFCSQEDSDKFFKEILDNAQEIFKELEIHYQIVDICTGDIGSFAARKLDIEAYLPGQDKFREMVSASNYRDYGARRLNARYQNEKNEVKLVHTLNSTAIALTRTLIAVIETHQTKNGNVKIPMVLRKYFDGREFLKNN